MTERNDIVVTWPKTRPLDSYVEELEKATVYGLEINFRVARAPDVKGGPMPRRCYMVHDGAVQGWNHIIAVTERGDGEVLGVAGQDDWPAGTYVVRHPEWYELREPVPMRGFQGWRWIDRHGAGGLLDQPVIRHTHELPLRFNQPCNDCPFRRNAVQGWLGASAPEWFVRSALADRTDYGGAPCHMTIDYTDPDWKEQAKVSASACAGSVIFAKNRGKTPNDPQRRANVAMVEADRETVFDRPDDFINYHRGGIAQSWDEEEPHD